MIMQRTLSTMMMTLVLAGGCDEAGNESDSCPVTEDAGAVQCGTFVDSDESDDTTSNEAVVACVAQAAGDARAFIVAELYFRNVGQFDTTRTHHVASNGDAWTQASGAEDLCTIDEITTARGVSTSALAQCEDWPCIEQALDEAEHVATCMNESSCDAV
jgi:hypothetical protein